MALWRRWGVIVRGRVRGAPTSKVVPKRVGIAGPLAHAPTGRTRHVTTPRAIVVVQRKLRHLRSTVEHRHRLRRRRRGHVRRRGRHAPHSWLPPEDLAHRGRRRGGLHGAEHVGRRRGAGVHVLRRIRPRGHAEGSSAVAGVERRETPRGGRHEVVVHARSRVGGRRHEIAAVVGASRRDQSRTPAGGPVVGFSRAVAAAIGRSAVPSVRPPAAREATLSGHLPTVRVRPAPSAAAERDVIGIVVATPQSRVYPQGCVARRAGQVPRAPPAPLLDHQRRLAPHARGIDLVQTLQTPSLQFLQSSHWFQTGILGTHPLQVFSDTAHAPLEQNGLLVGQGGIELGHLHQKRVQILPSPIHNLLDETAEIVDEAIVLLPRLNQLLLIAFDLIHSRIINGLPLAHGLVHALVHILHLLTVVIQVDPQLFRLFEMLRDARGQNRFPLLGVRQNVFGVLVAVHFILLVKLEVDGRVGLRVGLVRGHHFGTVAAVGGAHGRGRDVSGALEQRRVHRQRINGLGDFQSRLAVIHHGGVFVRQGGY
mmetsp:Transcript_36726/g.79268  ORF Transcript_36726/g.79268 Transcript_36726/m.79268 type:complete len:537 (+) Transcript_36726:390-2000(+)